MLKSSRRQWFGNCLTISHSYHQKGRPTLPGGLFSPLFKPCLDRSPKIQYRGKLFFGDAIGESVHPMGKAWSEVKVPASRAPVLSIQTLWQFPQSFHQVYKSSNFQWVNPCSTNSDNLSSNPNHCWQNMSSMFIFKIGMAIWSPGSAGKRSRSLVFSSSMWGKIIIIPAEEGRSWMGDLH